MYYRFINCSTMARNSVSCAFNVIFSNSNRSARAIAAANESPLLLTLVLRKRISDDTTDGVVAEAGAGRPPKLSERIDGGDDTDPNDANDAPLLLLPAGNNDGGNVGGNGIPPRNLRIRCVAIENSSMSNLPSDVMSDNALFTYYSLYDVPSNK
jgi:hypothetical protein